MKAGVRVGLLDTGVDAALAHRVGAARAFVARYDGSVVTREAGPDATGHGTAVARIVCERAPMALVHDAQVFVRGAGTAPAAVAAGLDWLVGGGVRLINMSLGYRRDRRVLRAACERALDAGCVLLAAAPARGPPVYPSAYPGVVRITGDARCAPEEISRLDTGQADFGACVHGPASAEAAGGASFGVAHATAALTLYLAGGGEAADCVEHLRRIARYHGPERRPG